MPRINLCLTIVLTVVAITFTLVTATAQVSLRSLLPADNSISGWKMIGGSEQAAVNQDGLYDLFNGAAPDYISHGVSSAVQRSFRRGDIIVVVDIHRHGSWQQAKTFFTRLAKNLEGNAGRMTTTNIKAHYTHGSAAGATVAYMWNNRYSCSITVSQASAGARETAQTFARFISKKISAAHP